MMLSEFESWFLKDRRSKTLLVHDMVFLPYVLILSGSVSNSLVPSTLLILGV